MPSTSLALLVAAHPDDETIGVGALLWHLKDSLIVHTTDGAPRDDRLRPEGASREAYAETRRGEALRALALPGISADRVQCLGATDQEAALDLPALARRLAGLIYELRPRVLITHAYEGGHPDHDATAFIVHAAIALVARHGIAGPVVAEMTSYHAEHGRFVASEFLTSSEAALTAAHGSWTLEHALTADERANKIEMMSCYASQRAVLAEFPLDAECLRRAPAYFFDRPPHPGPLHYETLGWPMTGATWRTLAIQAVDALHLRRGAL